METLLPTSVKTINFNGTEPLVGEFLTPWLIKVMNTFLLCSLKTKQQIAHVGPTIIIYFFFPLCLTQLKKKKMESPSYNFLSISLQNQPTNTKDTILFHRIKTFAKSCNFLLIFANIPLFVQKQSFACGNTCLLEENLCRIFTSNKIK